MNGTPVSTGGAAAVSGETPVAKFVFYGSGGSIVWDLWWIDARATCMQVYHLLRVNGVREAPCARV